MELVVLVVGFREIVDDFIAEFWQLGLLIAAGLIGGPYILGPVLIKQTLKNRAVPRIEQFDPATSPPPKKVAQFFRRMVAPLERAGFSVVAHLALPDQVPNVRTILVLLANRAADDQAIVVSMYAFDKSVDGRTVQLQNHYVEFSTDFTDGTSLSTNNSAEQSPFAPVPERRIVQFPEVRSPAALHRLHQRAVRELAGGTRQPVPSDADAIDALGRDMIAEFQSQVGTGYLCRTDDGKWFVPTWKGAFLMTWKLLWPTSALRRAARRRLAARLRAEWEPARDCIPWGRFVTCQRPHPQGQVGNLPHGVPVTLTVCPAAAAARSALPARPSRC